MRTGAAMLMAMSAVVVVSMGTGPLASASEPHCTVVGTARPDRLVGTPGRDVICGGRGNDVIIGRGGEDELRGGAGNDDLEGGAGDDIVSGGSGKDILTGGGGSDRLAGDSGADEVWGGAGNDAQSGGGGDDVLGGAGGDDDLSGDDGGDDIDGGTGFNICDDPADANDQQVRCVADESTPVVAEVTASPATVDVSEAAQVVRLEAHVTDDTGVTSVQIGNLASLVSGTSRDGIWAATIRVPRYIAPGPRNVDIDVRDRVGRSTHVTAANAYTVLDTVSDEEMPVLQSMNLSTTAVDVRSAAQPVTATIHVTDDLAGPTDLALCPAHAFPGDTRSFHQSGPCVHMVQSSGTPTDSTWEATYVVPQGAPSGTWNFEVWINDAAGNHANDFWFGPDELASIGPTNEPRYRAIPDDGGVFSVQGTDHDPNAPVLTSLDINPSSVDTSTGAVRVGVDIAGTDVEGITGAGLFIAGWSGYPNNPNWGDWVQVAWVQDFQLVSGTPQNGVWHATFVVPGGTPDGTYFVQASESDSSHYESWVSPDSPWTTNNHLLTPELAPTGDRFLVANS